MTNKPWITTYLGRQFFFTDPTIHDIFIEDIAHGLSNVCRYAGQCSVFYSVAEHSVRMSELAPTPRLKLLTLLHDGSEAYIGDVSSMLKKELHLYQEIETIITTVIQQRYGLIDLTEFEVAAVKELDAQIRTPEVLSLFPRHDGWTFSWSKVECEYPPIKPWPPKLAEKRFLSIFRRLYDHKR